MLSPSLDELTTSIFEARNDVGMTKKTPGHGNKNVTKWKRAMSFVS